MSRSRIAFLMVVAGGLWLGASPAEAKVSRRLTTQPDANLRLVNSLLANQEALIAYTNSKVFQQQKDIAKLFNLLSSPTANPNRIAALQADIARLQTLIGQGNAAIQATQAFTTPNVLALLSTEPAAIRNQYLITLYVVNYEASTLTGRPAATPFLS